MPNDKNSCHGIPKTPRSPSLGQRLAPNLSWMPPLHRNLSARASRRPEFRSLWGESDCLNQIPAGGVGDAHLGHSKGLSGVSGCVRRPGDRGSIQESAAGLSRDWRARGALIPRRHPHFDSDMGADFARVVIDEMPDAVVRDSPQLRPLPKCANRWLLAGREDPARPQTLYVG
jgi:hypothetical protein